MTSKNAPVSPAEKFYDDIITPGMAELEQMCDGEGIAMVAHFSWGPQAGATVMFGDRSGDGAIRLVELMSRANGNIDQFLSTVVQKFDTTQSLYLRHLQLRSEGKSVTELFKGEKRRDAIAAMRMTLKEELAPVADSDVYNRAHAIAANMLTALEGSLEG